MAIAGLRPAPFQAQWEPQNASLKIPELALNDKVKQIAYDIFSIFFFPVGIARMVGWLIGQLAKKIVLPSAWVYSHQMIRLMQNAFNVYCFGEVNAFNRRFRETFTTEKHQVETPDSKALLDVTVFRHRDAAAGTPSVLLAPSNSAISQQGIYAWLVEKAMDRGTVCNFVTFDYRGVSNSEGHADRIQDLLLDCDSVYQFVRDKMETPPEHIHTYGWSLGGGMTAGLKEMRPEINAPYSNERSFRSIRDVVKAHLPWLLKPLLFWIPKTFERQGWSFPIRPSAIQGPVLVIHHENDQIIPDAAGFWRSAVQSQIGARVISLAADENLQERERRQFVDHHSYPLSHYFVKGQPGTRADDAVADFILPPPAAEAVELA